MKQISTHLPFSLGSADSLEDPNAFEVLEDASGPNELSATAEKADDEEEEGIMTDDEDDLDIGADEELPDNEAGDSLLYILATSAEIFKFTFNVKMLQHIL